MRDIPLLFVIIVAYTEFLSRIYIRTRKCGRKNFLYTVRHFFSTCRYAYDGGKTRTGTKDEKMFLLIHA